MIPKSYTQAKKLYDLSVYLASNWISKYYPKDNYKISGILIEKVQAFSQHHFFSCLLEEKPIEDIWTQYPRTIDLSDNTTKIPSVLKLLFRSFDIIKQLAAPKENINHLENYDIIVLASGRHLKDFLELIQYLVRHHKILIIGKIPKDIQKKLRDSKVSYLTVKNGQKFIGRVDRLKDIAGFVGYFWTLRKTHQLLSGNQWLSRLWYIRFIQFPEIASLIRLARELFTFTKPKIIFTATSNDTFGAAFTLTAQSLGIKVVEIQHGIISYETIEKDFYLSDYYLVWGKISRELHPKNAFVAGCPYFKKPFYKKSNYLKKTGNIELLVLWSPPFGTLSLFKSKSNYEVLEDLIEGLSKLPKNFKITIRSHPSYPIENFLDKIYLPKNFSIDRNGNPENTIKGSDLVVTSPTTAGLIAILHKKPLLFFDNSFLFEKFGEPIANSKNAQVVPINQLKYIDQFVHRALKDDFVSKQKKYQEKFLKEYFDCLGKESIVKISKFLGEVIRHGSPKTFD